MSDEPLTFGTDEAFTGQITVVSTGTAVQADSNVVNAGGFWVKAMSTNTGDVMYVGNDGAGDVGSTNCWELTKTGPPMIIMVQNITDIWVDSDTSGDKVCWMKA